MAEIHIILGFASSKRRAFAHALIEDAFNKEESVLLLKSSKEIKNEEDTFFEKRQNIDVLDFEEISQIEDLAKQKDNFSSYNAVFIILYSNSDVIGDIEFLSKFFKQNTLEVCGIHTVINALYLEKNLATPWIEAFAHFSDTFTISNISPDLNKLAFALIEKFKKQYYPFSIEIAKKNMRTSKGVSSILDGVARRISTVFDDDETSFIDLEADEIVLEDENGNALDLKDDEVLDSAGIGKVDLYFERDKGGKRAKILPDLSDVVL